MSTWFSCEINKNRRFLLESAGLCISVSPLSIDMPLDAVDDHFQSDQVLSALRNDQICVFLAGLHELLMHRLDGRQILFNYGINGAATLFDVAPDPPAQQ